MFQKGHLTYFLILVAIGCAQKITNSAPTEYSEDLSGLRTPYAYENQKQIADTISTQEQPDPAGTKDSVQALLNIKPKLDEFLDTLSANNRSKAFIQGYTIQVYTGNNREAANEAKTLVYKILPDSFPQLTYQQPNFKVKVGHYFTRFEAHKSFVKLKREFPRAIIMPERFVIE